MYAVCVYLLMSCKLLTSKNNISVSVSYPVAINTSPLYSDFVPSQINAASCDVTFLQVRRLVLGCILARARLFNRTNRSFAFAIDGLNLELPQLIVSGIWHRVDPHTGVSNVWRLCPFSCACFSVLQNVATPGCILLQLGERLKVELRRFTCHYC